MQSKHVVVAMAAALFTAVAAQAQGTGWQWSVTPYAWLAGIEGDVGARGVSVPVEKDFGDVWDDLSMAGMVSIDGYNGQWGTFLDVVFLNLDAKKDTPAGEIGADVEQWLVSLVPYVRLSTKPPFTVDVGAGGRYTEVDLDVSGPRGGQSESASLIDPVVAGRVRWQAATRCSVTVAGDIGGFGVGSDMTWQLMANAGYRLGDATELQLGYRILSYDYEEDGMLYDVDTAGLQLGLAISF